MGVNKRINELEANSEEARDDGADIYKKMLKDDSCCEYGKREVLESYDEDCRKIEERPENLKQIRPQDKKVWNGQNQPSLLYKYHQKST